MLNEAQLKARMYGISGSDVGAILGLNQYRSPLDVFIEKTGKVEPPDLSDNDLVHFDNVLEDVVANEYTRRHGVKVRRRNTMFKTPDSLWMLANIDRSVDGQKKVLECKTADAWIVSNWGPDGSDEVPDSYLVQDVWYMAVLGYLPLKAHHNRPSTRHSGACRNPDNTQDGIMECGVVIPQR